MGGRKLPGGRPSLPLSRLTRAPALLPLGFRGMQADETAALAAGGVAPTDDSGKYSWDVAPSATVRAVLLPDGKTFASAPVDLAALEGETLGIVLDATTFYAEAGGQVAY